MTGKCKLCHRAGLYMIRDASGTWTYYCGTHRAEATAYAMQVNRHTESKHAADRYHPTARG